MRVTTNSLSRAVLLFSTAAILGLSVGCHKKDKTDTNPSTLGPAPTENAAPEPTANFTAEPSEIDLGQSVVLNWRTMNANSVTIDGIGNVPVNGTQTVTPSSSTNFHLIAKGEGGVTGVDVRVMVRVPVAPSAPVAAAAPSTDMGDESAFKRNVQDIFFDYDDYNVRPEAQSSVAQAAAYLNAHPAIRVVIGGYCDERGSAEYNLALGENRANAAKSALVNAGVSSDRMRVISYGKEKQFCSESSESCWQQNRRAQFSLDR